MRIKSSKSKPRFAGCVILCLLLLSLIAVISVNSIAGPRSVYPYKFFGYEDPSDPTNSEKALKIKEAFNFAYTGYETRCFGKGELLPVSGDCVNFLTLGLTIIDSLDTMLIMGFRDMYDRAIVFLKESMNWDRENNVSVFEMNIRCLGGLLAAYHITKDQFLLDQAILLGDQLMYAFNSPNGFPYTWIKFKTHEPSLSGWTQDQVILSEYGTLQLEFAYLSYLTGNMSYFDKALGVYAKMIETQPKDKLYPVFANVRTSAVFYDPNAKVGIGSLSDSFYEYQVKYWIMTKRKNDAMKKWYYETAQALIDQLGVQHSTESFFLREKELYSSNKEKTFEHLSCFSGAMLAIGSIYADDPVMKAEHLKAAEGIAHFCHEMYTMNPTGLPCDIVTSSDGKVECLDDQYIMRPEAIETWFYLWRITGKQKYRDWGWEFFQAIEKHTKQKYGYSGLRHANAGIDRLEPKDKQESFFLAETLKYLYLMFVPNDVLPLDKVVFNTEAHPFPLFDELKDFIAQAKPEHPKTK